MEHMKPDIHPDIPTLDSVVSLPNGWRCCNDMIFRNACCFGKTDVALWLLAEKDADVHAVNDDAFAMACENGHLDTAMALVEWADKFSDRGVNVSARDWLAFRLACPNGHLTTAQWLASLGADADVLDQRALTLACDPRYSRIIHWIVAFKLRSGAPRERMFDIADIYPSVVHRKVKRVHVCALVIFRAFHMVAFAGVQSTSRKRAFRRQFFMTGLK